MVMLPNCGNITISCIFLIVDASFWLWEHHHLMCPPLPPTNKKNICSWFVRCILPFHPQTNTISVRDLSDVFFPSTNKNKIKDLFVICSMHSSLPPTKKTISVRDFFDVFFPSTNTHICSASKQISLTKTTPIQKRVIPKIKWHETGCYMTVSTENATPPKSTKSRNSNSVVQIQIKPKSLDRQQTSCPSLHRQHTIITKQNYTNTKPRDSKHKVMHRHFLVLFRFGSL